MLSENKLTSFFLPLIFQTFLLIHLFFSWYGTGYTRYIRYIDWGAYAQNRYFDAQLQVDFEPTDLIAIDQEGWIRAAAIDLCEFIQCQEDGVTMSILRVRNITRSRTGIVLLQGIEQVSMQIKNPVVWGLPALSTQYRNMEVVFKNPQAAIYDVPYGRFTSGGAGTLLMTPGPLDPFSPSFNFIMITFWIVGLTALFNTVFILYFDPDTATDPYPEGWETEGLDDIGEAKSDLGDPNVPRAPPTDAELKAAAVKAAKEREKNDCDTKERKRKSKLRFRRGFYSCFCYPILIVTFVKTSLRDTRESFLLVTTKMIVTCCQTIPLSAMFMWLSFATPRGITDLILFCIFMQFLSICMALTMWERSALRTEKNLILRLMHPAVLRMTGARFFELTSTLVLFGLFTAQYGVSSIFIILGFDMICIAVMMILTWRQQNYTLAGTRHKWWGVARRYWLSILLLLAIHFDHVPGKSGEGHSIINTRMYYAWKVGRHGVLSIAILIGIGEMTELVAGGWYAIGFSLAMISLGCMMLLLNAAMLSWQDFLNLPQVGLKIPLPKQCRRETLKDEDEEQGKSNMKDMNDLKKSSRMTLMAMYGQKASAMEEAGKQNKDLRRRLEEERQKRHARGEYSDDEHEDHEEENSGGDNTEEGVKEAPYVFEGVNLDRINDLMNTLLEETKGKCQGCEGLSTSHDDNCQLEEYQTNEYGKRKKKKKNPYRFQREEESAEVRGQKVRKHVEFALTSPNLSFEARRIQRLQGKAPTPESSPVVKERVPLSQQASSLHRLGGSRLF